eukprot:CAMPEP_0196575148 /NCGR_PEP_ID=MMETSP1081-20130531/4685_1 /TAXON_ID=36882 /ORGANISM="Pyramimonas amylifera, Strain CCMP720" /LENGTH=661 /DNA_ID=CAMNT_0041893351 /DNA_START=673 /DNA_END=2658 /DNA_ORIENTATION=-
MSLERSTGRTSLDVCMPTRSLPAYKRTHPHIVHHLDKGIMTQDGTRNVSVGFRVNPNSPKNEDRKVLPDTYDVHLETCSALPRTGLLRLELAKAKKPENSCEIYARSATTRDDSIASSFALPQPEDLLKNCDDPVLRAAQERHDVFRNPVVQLAFRVAKSVHTGLLCNSGNAQVSHCVEIAMQLASSGMEPAVVAAGLLHNCLNDTCVTKAYLERLFETQTVACVFGATKLCGLREFCQAGLDSLDEDQVDRLRAMLLSMANVHSVMIMLADQLQKLRTLPSNASCATVQETRKVYIPLANRLGVWNIKSEMEDLCFKYEDPEAYLQLSESLADCTDPLSIISSISGLQEMLESQDVKIQDIVGRHKNIYGVHKKMVSKNKSLEEVLDIRALRIVVENEEECYKALNACHYLWTVVKERTKDYIRKPKGNGYQSLHTVVTSSDGLPLEIQIRTAAMHEAAENGVAAHWRYKEGSSESNAFHDKQVAWARYVLSWQSELNDHKLRAEVKSTCSSCCFPEHNQGCLHKTLERKPFSMPQKPSDNDPVYVVVVDGLIVHVHELPPKSTTIELRAILSQSRPMDYVQLFINGEPEEEGSSSREIHMGDQIELAHPEFREKVGFHVDLSPTAVLRERRRLSTMSQFGDLTALSTRKDGTTHMPFFP